MSVRRHSRWEQPYFFIAPSNPAAATLAAAAARPWYTRFFSSPPVASASTPAPPDVTHSKGIFVAAAAAVTFVAPWPLLLVAASRVGAAVWGVAVSIASYVGDTFPARATTNLIVGIYNGDDSMSVQDGVALVFVSQIGSLSAPSALPWWKVSGPPACPATSGTRHPLTTTLSYWCSRRTSAPSGHLPLKDLQCTRGPSCDSPYAPTSCANGLPAIEQLIGRQGLGAILRGLFVACSALNGLHLRAEPAPEAALPA